MTTDDWWLRIAEFTITGDWNGILVAADALEELGEADAAAGLRWAIRNDHLPTEEPSNLCWHFRLGLDIDGVWTKHHSVTGLKGIVYAWQWVVNFRRYLLEQLTQ